MKVYGPYVRKDGRLIVIKVTLVNGVQRHKTISYPRYIMEEHLQRSLMPDEDIHHIDGDVSNNDLSNLRVINKSEHVRAHSTKHTYNIMMRCVFCNTPCVIPANKMASFNADRRRGKAGPFCSRKCSGRYGAEIRKSQ